MARIRRKPGVRYPVLTPNLKGFEAALAAKADEVAVFVAATESFSRKNINCSIAESLERARPIYAAAKAHGVRVRGYISCVLGCPYEGDVDPARVAEVAAALYGCGSYEVSLGDTIGTGTAGRTRALIATVAERVPVAALAGHFHDTYGQALTNSTWRWKWASRRSTARSRASADARTRRARPATSRARMSSTCSTGSASTPAST